jgi:hypothetical protein
MLHTSAARHIRRRLLARLATQGTPQPAEKRKRRVEARYLGVGFITALPHDAHTNARTIPWGQSVRKDVVVALWRCCSGVNPET